MSIVEVGEGIGLGYMKLGSGQKVVVFLHGIMGNKKNLRSFVQNFVAQHEDVCAVIFDLPNHGDSSRGFTPSIDGCAESIRQALSVLQMKPYALVGHSFGAKVALLCAEKIPQTKAVFMLDASPGVYQEDIDKKGSKFNTLTLIRYLEELAWPLATRQELINALVALGAPNQVALWMTTNLVEEDGRFRLVFDPAIIRKMLENFLQTDLWPVVYSVGTRTQVHLVAAQYGGRLLGADAEKLSLLPQGMGFFHELKNAGHFLHTDNPEGLLAIMKPYF